MTLFQAVREAVREAVTQIREPFGIFLDQDQQNFLQELLDSDEAIGHLYQSLPADAVTQDPETWRGWVHAAQRQAAVRSTGFLTAYAEGTNLDDEEVQQARHRFVRVFLSEQGTETLRTHIVHAGKLANPDKFPDPWQDPVNRGLLAERYRHAIAHELLHVLMHRDWELAVGSHLVNDVQRNLLFEGITEHLARRARGVPRMPEAGPDGYGYWEFNWAVQSVWDSPCIVDPPCSPDGPQNFGVFAQQGFFGGGALLARVVPAMGAQVQAAYEARLRPN